MPYKEIEVDAEVALVHNGVTLYHTYKDNDFNNGPNGYWFSLTARDQSEQFDVRDLPGGEEITPLIPFINSPEFLASNEAQQAAIKQRWDYWFQTGEREIINNVLRRGIEQDVLSEYLVQAND